MTLSRYGVALAGLLVVLVLVPVAASARPEVSSARSITVIRRPVAALTVSIKSPMANSAVSGSVVWAVDYTGSPTAVAFAIDGKLVWTQPHPPFIFRGDGGRLDTTTLSNGNHELQVVAVNGGEQSTSSIEVTVRNVASVGSPPSNSAAPTVAGTAAVSKTLTVNPGGWIGTQPLSFAYTWLRCANSTTQSACAPVPGATSSSYTSESADVGSYLRVRVTGSNAYGSVSAISTATAQVSGTPPSPSPKSPSSSPPPGPSVGVANVWVGAGGSCVRSAVSAVYNAATSCSSFDTAYHAAAVNDLVSVRCGTFGGQILSADSSKAGGTVTFQPEVGGCVTVSSPSVGFSLGSGVSYLTLRGFSINAPNGGVASSASGVSRNVTIDGNWINVGKRVNGCCGILASSVDGWKIVNNTLGPWCCGTTNGSSPEGIRVGTPNAVAPMNTNVLIDNNLIQDIGKDCSYWPSSGYGSCPDTPCTAAGCHMDGIHIWGLTNSTISRNRIYNAEVQGIFLEQANNSLNANINIVNNAVTVVGGSAGIYVKGVGTNTTGGTWNIAFNSVIGNIDLPGTGVIGVQSGTVFNLTGNIGRLMVQSSGGNNAGCKGFAAGETINYLFNVWAPTNGGTAGPCSPTDRGSITTRFVNPTLAPSGGTDLHLAAGTQVADNFVPSGICTSVVGTDFDGQSRPLGTACDAGADEH